VAERVGVLDPQGPAHSTTVSERGERNRLTTTQDLTPLVPSRGFSHYPDAYLTDTLGLVRLALLTRTFPCANA